MGSLPLFAAISLTLAAGLVLGSEPSLGKKLYEARCSSCHGRDAKGSPEASKDLKADILSLDLTRNPSARRSEASLRKLVARGHGRMPKQGELTSTQVRELVKYLRSLQKEYASTER